MIGFKTSDCKNREKVDLYISSYYATRLIGFHIIGFGTLANSHSQACALRRFRALVQVTIVIYLKALIFISCWQP